MKSTTTMKKISIRRTGDIRMTSALCANQCYVNYA